MYFQSEIGNSKHEMRKLWGVINSLTNQNAKPSSPSRIIFGNTVINNPAERAEELNKHFCGIGKKFSDKADILNPTNFNQ